MNIDAEITDGLLIACGAVGTTLDLPVAYPDVPFDKENNDEYLEITVFRNTTGSPTWGEDANYIGILQIELIDKSQTGSIGSTDKAGLVKAMFHKNRTIFHNGIKIKINQHPTILTPIVDPHQTSYPVSIPYLVTRAEQG